MNKKMTLTILTASIAVAMLAGCQPNDPERTTPPAVVPAVPPEKPMQIFDKHFDFARSESTVQQAKYDQNTVSASFTMKKGDQSVFELKTSDLRVTENGSSVTQFSLTAAHAHFEQVADIVFLVDVTKSMGPLIETAKKRLADFVVTSRAKGYHTRMCIQSFGDYTVKHCTRFFENNPADPSTEAQVKELLTELAQLHSYDGKEDPGAPDYDENPMRSLIETATVPWGKDSLRFVILVTDAGFLYRANNSGDKDNSGYQPLLERNNPPKMSEVTQTLKSSQMKVFAVTRMQEVRKGQTYIYDGYNSSFQGEPGIVQASGGEWFDFDKVRAGQITIDSILQRILNRIDTTFTLTYVVDKNPGLDPTLTNDKRNVVILPANPAQGTISKPNVSSSMPTGHPQYQQTWKVSDNAVQPGSMHVFVDGKELGANDFTVSKGDVKLTQVPKAGAQIRFTFLYDQIEKNFRIEPLSFKGVLNPATTTVFLNGKEARTEDLVFTKDLEGNSTLGVGATALAANDPYDIRKNQGLTIRVQTK
jgi:hypothetical protein